MVDAAAECAMSSLAGSRARRTRLAERAGVAIGGGRFSIDGIVARTALVCCGVLWGWCGVFVLKEIRSRTRMSGNAGFGLGKGSLPVFALQNLLPAYRAITIHGNATF